MPNLNEVETGEDPETGLLSCRAALSCRSSVFRVMASTVLFLSDLSEAAAAWGVFVRGDRIDPSQPVIHWIGPGGGEPLHGVEGDRGAGLSAALKGPESVIRVDPPVSGGHAWDLPASRSMGKRGLTARMLLLCRHDEETAGILGFLQRTGEAGFSEEASGMLAASGPVAGHVLSVVRTVDFRYDSRHSDRLASLSARETEVATLAARGIGNAEIAVALGISAGTVKSHLHRSFEKLGVDSRTRLALLISHERRAIGGD